MNRIWFPTTLLLLSLCSPAIAVGDEKQKEKEKKAKKPEKIIEEILVTGIAPRDLPASSVTVISKEQLEWTKPRDLAEAVRYAPGVTVSVGSKNEYTLSLRGLASGRIILLVDGIPVYEPYYSSFDLKTVSAGGIDFIQVSKGPSSVLYGPNSLGGIVNVVTQRPGDKPELSLDLSLGEARTRSAGIYGSARSGRISFVGSVLYQDSNGFYYADPDGTKTKRENSDYSRLNVNTKVYYHPSDRSEWMLNAGVYTSEYGMPAELDAAKPRYWRFKNWDRYTINAGGYTPLGDTSLLRLRAYYVQYDNTLDWFNDAEMADLRSSSTFDNSVLGLFALTDFHFGKGHSLKFSANFKRDTARTQDDVGEPWEETRQGTFSLAAEDHLDLSPKWRLFAGISLDYLNKFIGENATRLNPLIGMKYTPVDHLSLHLSLACKSRFPSMRAMYSGTSGNPDLLSESGRMAELGLTYSKGFLLTGAVFFTSFKDMIDSIRNPDGTRMYINVAEAFISGFDLQFQKSLRSMDMILNYTFLHHRNQTLDRPLDALPDHNLNFQVQIRPLRRLTIALSGLYASTASWYDTFTEELLEIPAHFNLDAVLAYRFCTAEMFFKAGNIFNADYYTEPRYPLRGRYVEIGIKFAVF